MYEQFYGFRERPFDLTPNPRYLVLTESHREALSNLEYGIASKKGITLLVGEAGSGKTTVIRTAIERQPGRVHCVYLHNPTLSRGEFVEMLAARFHLSERASKSKAAMLIEFEELLRQRRDAGETTVLVVDEAQSLPLDLLEEIRLLANIETESEKLLSVIIAGQPEIIDRLNEQALRQFKQRVALRCELRPLTLQETVSYIAGRIRAAGGQDAQVFTREAVTMMHERAHGLPRMISVIADNALLGGFAAGERPVGSKIVREVCKDFDFAPADPFNNGSGRPSSGATGPKSAGPEKNRSNASSLVGPWKDRERASVPRLIELEKPPKPLEMVQPRAVGGSDHGTKVGLFGGFTAKRKRFSFFGN
jgi:general secretion pathway protein A